MEATNIRFVGEVEKYPELYDYTTPEYSRKDMVEKAWAKIGKQFNLTGNESKEKWRNLRNTFVKNLKPGPTGTSARKKKTYYLSEAMQFALPFVKASGAISEKLSQVPIPVSTAVPEDPLAEEDDVKPDLDEITLSPQSLLESLPEPPTPPSPPPRPSTSSSVERKRRDAGRVADFAYFAAKRKNLETKQQLANIPSKSEALKMYFNSLMPDLEPLDPSLLREFKRRTLELVDELWVRASRNPQSTVTTSSEYSP